MEHLRTVKMLLSDGICFGGFLVSFLGLKGLGCEQGPEVHRIPDVYRD